MDALFEIISSLFSPEMWAALPARFDAFQNVIAPYATVVSLLFLTGIVYCFLRIEQIVEETSHHDAAEEGAEERGAAAGESATAKRWERIQAHAHSGKESDWRLAVLEADVLLDELVTNMGYRGDSLGERLKGVEKSDFTTVDKAWEAHAVRNKIAHEGAAFALSEREAKRVLSLYEEVFKEFRYI